MLALDGCFVARSNDGNVEVVEAGPAHRVFPARVTEAFGVCMKTGPDHRVIADGREVVFPAGSICVRPPGCVWSTEGTGPVGFLSLDLDPSLLPRGLRVASMCFVDARSIPELGAYAGRLRVAAPNRTSAIVSSLVLALEDAGALQADELRESPARRSAARVREAFEAEIGSTHSLVELAAKIGTNRFALMRDFKRRFGITPHAFLVRLRIERARERIARGADLADVAVELGFSDQPHLSRVFSRVVGMTPGEYARSVRRLSLPMS